MLNKAPKGPAGALLQVIFISEPVGLVPAGFLWYNLYII